MATLVWAAVSGCNRVDDYRTMFRLGERLSTAEIHREIDRIDLGTEGARELLGPGWSWNESSGDTTYV